MADESDEDVVEDQNGLSKVDDEELPEHVPRPEKPEDDPDLGGGDDAGTVGDGTPSEEPTGGLSKVDSDEEPNHSQQPNPRDAGLGGDGPPGESGELPFDPDASRATGVDYSSIGPDRGDDGPPPGHSPGAVRPGEVADDEASSGTGTGSGSDPDPERESEADAESPEDDLDDGAAGDELDFEDAVPDSDVDPETKAKLDPGGVEQVEKPPAEPDVTTADPADADEQLGGAPIAEPDYDVPEYEDQWDTKPSQPPDDEEMPLADHIEEMVQRLGVVLLTLAVGTAVSFVFAEFVLMAMWNGLVPGGSVPHVYGPMEKVLAEIKVASLGGVLIALPVLVYESYLFMRPGLYPKERRYYLAAVPTSLVLGGVGMVFSYFAVLPVLFEYFIYYSEDGVDRLAFGLQVTFDLIVTMLWAFALVFQIPLLIMLAIMMGVTTRAWLESKRLYFWGGFIAVGFFLGGIDPTSVAGMIIAATMIGLFEGTLAILRWAQGDLPWRNRGSSA